MSEFQFDASKGARDRLTSESDENIASTVLKRWCTAC